VLTNKALRNEGAWGSGRIDPHFLDLGTSWRWVISFTSRPLNPPGISPGTHWTGGWGDPRAGLDDVKKRKFLTLPRLGLRPLACSARSQSLHRLRYPGERMEVRKQNLCSFLSSTYLSLKGIMHHSIRMPQITNAVTVFPDLMQLFRKVLEFACV
jgi:hypothetical protein